MACSLSLTTGQITALVADLQRPRPIKEPQDSPAEHAARVAAWAAAKTAAAAALIALEAVES